MRSAVAMLRAPRLRKLLKRGLLTALVVAVLAYFAVPPLLRHWATHQLSSSLGRPVALGSVRFNPLNLNLRIDDLHIGERGGDASFVDIGRLQVNLSLASLWRRAPVLDALSFERPQLHLLRGADRRFNFSDLLQADPGADPKAEPLRYALANIVVSDGTIDFDDQLLGTRQRVEKIDIGVPFLANLPSASQIYVEPLLAFEIDGHPQRIVGKTKPFDQSKESVLEFHLNELDLPRYLAYLPERLPLSVAQGTLSGLLQLHFVEQSTEPQLSLSGTLVLDDLDLRDPNDGPLLRLQHLQTSLADVRPLRRSARLNTLQVDGLAIDLVLLEGGRTNFSALTDAAPGAPAAEPVDLGIADLRLNAGALKIRNALRAEPNTLAIERIDVQIAQLQTRAAPPASFTLAAQLGEGSVKAKGKLRLDQQQAEFELDGERLDLPTLQQLTAAGSAPTISAGAIGLQSKLQLDYSTGHFNLHAEPTTLAVDGFALAAAPKQDAPVSWKALRSEVERFDLATAELALTSVQFEGLKLSLRRARDGRIDLANLPPPPGVAASTTPAAAAVVPDVASPAAAPASPAVATAPQQWKVGLAHGVLADAAIHFEDQGAGRPVKLDLSAIALQVEQLGPDFSQPAKLDLAAGFGHKGTLKLSGSVAPQPLKAELQLDAIGLDVAVFEPYVASALNTTIASAVLSAHGSLDAVEQQPAMLLRYRGDATLGRVRMQDKLSGDDFLRWTALSASKLDLVFGPARPQISLGSLALADFYARVIVNSNGKINLQDVIAHEDQAPVSLTRAEPGAVPQAPKAAEAAVVPGAPAAAGRSDAGADIAVQRITLQGGRINYTDNFIKPNFTADLTEIGGSVGAFGTASEAPAAVTLRGKFEHSAPISIDGRINPLAASALVDITAKAEGVELTHLTPYSAKYAGYPIEKGNLNFDVHYLLEHGKLSADNHIFIDQLTFGARVESPQATKLPVTLAVALLKNGRGEIDVHIPVSGSLDDPQFSLGGVIAQAFLNAIISAVTSPFRLLAAAFGGGEELSFVEFAPGSAALTPETTARLDTIAKALTERPSLRLEISARVDPELDRPGVRDALLEARIKAAKLKELAAHGEDADPEQVTVDAAERDQYLERVYKAADFPKPKNFIGLAAALPPEEMSKLLLANITVSDADLADLADRRAEAVRVALAERVAPDRLFSVAPKLDASGIKDQGKTTRVDFSLQ